MFKFWHAVSAEFKNQRVVFYSAGALAAFVYAFLHWGPWRNPRMEFCLFHFILSLIVFAFAAIAGSLVFRRETDNSRIRPFDCTIQLSLGCLSAVIPGILLAVATGLSVRFNDRNWIFDSFYPDFAYFQYVIFDFSGAFLVYTCSIFFHRILVRPVLSALTGFVLGSAIAFSTASFWIRLDFVTWSKWKPTGVAVVLCGVLLLLFAWILAGRLKTIGTLNRFVLGLSIALVTAIFSSALVFPIQSSSEKLAMGGPELSPKGTEIVSDAYGEYSHQIWMIPTDPEKANSRFIKKHARDANVSPDGQWIAFYSQEGIFGLRSFYADLRVAKTDGTQERNLLPRFARWFDDESGIGYCQKAFSPDSRYVALLSRTMICVVDLDAKIKSQASIPYGSDKKLLGWRPNRLEVLLGDHDHRCIETYNFITGRFRTIYQAKQTGGFLAPKHSGSGIKYVLLAGDNELVDLDKGSVQLLPQIAHTSVSIDQSTLIYYHSGDRLHPADSSAYIRRFDIKTGQDYLVAEFKGAINQIPISPDGNRIAVELETEFGKRQTIVMSKNSLICKFEGWGVIGWRNSNTAVLADNNLFPTRMALGDIATGRIQQFYP
jgi:hypothetical protein